jgi:hypothetical protein
MGGATTTAAAGSAAEPDRAMPWLRSYPAGVDWDVPFPTETLPGMFDASGAWA